MYPDSYTTITSIDLFIYFYDNDRLQVNQRAGGFLFANVARGLAGIKRQVQTGNTFD